MVSDEGRGKARNEWVAVYSALEVCVSLKSPARLSASSSDMSMEAPSRLRFRRPVRLEEKVLTGPPRLTNTKGTKQVRPQLLQGVILHSEKPGSAKCEVRRSRCFSKKSILLA